jgi:hypothetical protein
MTGTSARTSGGASVNTHTPATWVLGTIALILVVNSLGLLGYAKERRAPTSAPDPG